jgi:hypothetical protein
VTAAIDRTPGSGLTTAIITTGTSITAAKPSGLVSGNALGAYMYFRNATVTPTAPSGWTLASPVVTAHLGFALYVKPVPDAALESANDYTFTANASGRGVLEIFRITDADLSALVDVIGGFQNTQTAGSLGIITPSATTTQPDVLLLCCTALNVAASAAVLITPDPGMTEGHELDVDSTASTSLEWAYETRTTAGATGTRNPTWPATGSSAATFLVGIAPADVVPPSPTGGWVAEGAGVTLSQNTATPLDGATSLRATKTFGAGLDFIEINDGGQLEGDLSAAGDTFGTLVRVTWSGGSGAQIRMKTRDANLDWQIGGWWTPTSGTTFELLHTPGEGLMEQVRGVGFRFEATGVSGTVILDVDRVRQGNYAPAIAPAQAWQAADNAAYAAVHAAGFTGSGREYHAAGYNWSGVKDYAATNGFPWITADDVPLPSGYYTEPFSVPAALDAYETKIGERPSIVMWYLGWDEAFPASRCATVRDRGQTPMLSWKPDQPTWTNAAIAAGAANSYIDTFAAAVKAYGGPVWIRLGFEMNGDWGYQWQDLDFVAMWNHVRGRFDAQNVTNAVWVWSPNVVAPHYLPLEDVYPGDDKVDVVGLDGYNWGTTQSWSGWQLFASVFDASIVEMRALVDPSKPFWITETASTEIGGDKAAWITDMFAEIVRYGLAGFIWFDADKETDWRVDSSAAALAAFKAGSPILTTGPATEPLPGLRVRYSGVAWHDNDRSGTYAASFATETTNAIAQGHVSVDARALAWLDHFTSWLAIHGQAGVVEKTGWPDTEDWNTVGAAVLAAATSAGVDVDYWAVSEMLGINAYALLAWEWNGTAWIPNAQATVLSAYLDAPLPPPSPPPEPFVRPTLQVQMAIGGSTTLDPQAAGIFLLDRSVLDGPDTLGVIAWVDVAADVKSITVNSSTSGGLDSASPTTFSVVVDNASGDYDPVNPASPYDLDVGQQVWVRAEYEGNMYSLVYGYIDDIVPDYGWEPTVTFTCSDGLAVLGRAKIGEIAPAYDGDTTGQRINRILDAAYWPTTLRSVATGLVTVQNDTYGDWALPLIGRIADTELGAIFIDGDGKFVFHDRLQVYLGARSTTVQATMSDTGDDIDMEELPAALRRGETFNEARVTREGGVEQVAVDADSLTKYGLQTFPGSVGTMARFDGDALSLATWLVARYKNPEVRFPEITVDATTQGKWAELLALRKFDRVQIVRDYGPASFDREVLIDGIGHTITPDTWQMTFSVRDIDVFTPFLLGTSLLDGADQLV